MKKNYVKPMVFEENFEANEYVAACWAYDLTSGATINCDQAAHPENVSFYSSDLSLTGIRVKCTEKLYAYDASVVYIDTKGTADPRDDVAHWVTVRGWNTSIGGITATTDHYSKIPCKRGVNRS